MKTLEQRMLALGEGFCIHNKGGKFYTVSYNGRPLEPTYATLEELVTAEEDSRRASVAQSVARARAELEEELARQRDIEEALRQ